MLNQCAPRSGFMSADLFSPGIVNFEKKYERKHSSEGQKTDTKAIFRS